jgi:hypothetical protein
MKAIMRDAFLERTGMESVSFSFLQQPKNNPQNILDMIGQTVIPFSSLPKVRRE